MVVCFKDFSRSPGNRLVIFTGLIFLAVTLTSAQRLDCQNHFPCLLSSLNHKQSHLQLQSRFRLHAQLCHNSRLDRLILNPPTFIGNDESGHGITYILWLNELLDSNQTFCNPLKNLHCGPLPSSRTCQCLTGSEWEPASQKCVIPVGKICPYDAEVYEQEPGGSSSAPVYFDPSSPPETFWTESISVTCAEGTFCMRPAYFLGPLCMNAAQVDFSRAVRTHFQAVSDTPFGQPCDHADHQLLYTMTADERGNFLTRLDTLQSLQRSGRHFCDLHQFLTCGTGRSCECSFPANFDQGKQSCELAPPYDQCGKYHDIAAIANNDSLVHEVKEDFAKAFEGHVASCGGFFQCVLDDEDDDGASADSDMEMYCLCAQNKAGEKCNENLSKFLSRIRPAFFPTDIENFEESRQVFYEFNAVALDFETVFNRGEGVECNADWEVEARRAERILRSFDNKNRFGKTRKDYEDAGMLAKLLLGTDRVGHGVCNSFQGLKCKWNGFGLGSGSGFGSGSGSRDENSGAGICSRNVSLAELAKHVLARVAKLPCGTPCDPNIPNPYGTAQFTEGHGGAGEAALAKLEETWVVGTNKFCTVDETGLKDNCLATTGGSGGVCTCPVGTLCAGGPCVGGGVRVNNDKIGGIFVVSIVAVFIQLL